MTKNEGAVLESETPVLAAGGIDSPFHASAPKYRARSHDLLDAVWERAVFEDFGTQAPEMLTAVRITSPVPNSRKRWAELLSGRHPTLQTPVLVRPMQNAEPTGQRVGRVSDTTRRWLTP